MLASLLRVCIFEFVPRISSGLGWPFTFGVSGGIKRCQCRPKPAVVDAVMLRTRNADEWAQARFADLAEERIRARFTHLAEERIRARFADLADKWTLVRFADLADEWALARFADLADEWTLARFADLADKRTHARLADLAEKWTHGRLIDMENGRVNLQFENGREVEDGSGPSCSGVNPGEERPGPRIDLKQDGERPSFSGVNPDQVKPGPRTDLKDDGSGPSCSGVNPGQERPGPRIDLKHDGERPSFSGVNPGSGPRTDLKHDGRCPSFSCVNPGLVLGPRTELKHKLSVLQNAVFYGSGVGQSDRGVDVVLHTVPKSSIDQMWTCCPDPTCNKQVCRRRRWEECDGTDSVLVILWCAVYACVCLLPACLCLQPPCVFDLCLLQSLHP